MIVKWIQTVRYKRLPPPTTTTIFYHRWNMSLQFLKDVTSGSSFSTQRHTWESSPANQSHKCTMPRTSPGHEENQLHAPVGRLIPWEERPTWQTSMRGVEKKEHPSIFLYKAGRWSCIVCLCWLVCYLICFNRLSILFAELITWKFIQGWSLLPVIFTLQKNL